MRRIANVNPGGINVATTSTQVLAARDTREMLMICNDSDETIYVSLGGTASMNSGIRLNASGGSYTLSYPQTWTGAVSAICTSGNKRLTFIEGY